LFWGFSSPKQKLDRWHAECAHQNGFTDPEKHDKIIQGLNLHMYGLDGFNVALSTNPDVMKYFDELESPPVPVTLPENPILSPFMKRECLKKDPTKRNPALFFSVEKMRTLTIQDLKNPIFDYRAKNSPVLKHLDVLNIDSLRSLMSKQNQYCERLVSELSHGSCIQQIRNRYIMVKKVAFFGENDDFRRFF